MSRGCVLCGERKHASKEDAVPLWVNGLLADTHDGPFQTVIDGVRIGDVTERPRKIITRRPCRDCNGWMNTHFEQPARPLLEPMIRDGEERVLNAAEQQTVAGWVVKTTMMLRLFAGHHVAGKPQFPESEYRRLRTDGTPGESMLVWLGARAYSKRTDEPGPLAASQPGPLPKTYFAHYIGSTWSLGHLVAQVLYKRGRQDWALQNRADVAGAVNRIWPVSIGGVKWPPRYVLSTDQIAVLGLSLVDIDPH